MPGMSSTPTSDSAHCGYDFYCYHCNTPAPADALLACEHCGTPRSIRSQSVLGRGYLMRPPESLWHYFGLLPIRDRSDIVTLGEGATPLIDAPRLAKTHGFGELRLKNEATNPTGSFKDRQVSVGISHARSRGVETVAAVSSGNVACATAAYAARAGMRAVLFMHGQAGAGKIAQAVAYGATVLRVDSPSPAAVFDLCLDACARWGWQHLSTAGMYEPYNVEGAKTIAYELWRQYEGDLPDWIVAPVGGGGLLGGVWRGLLDLKRLGLIGKLPRLAGVQAAGCAPVPQAMAEGWSFLESLKHPWPNPNTIAGGIADDIIFDGHTVLPAIRTTGGTAIAVDDDAIRAGLYRLAREEGILCELTCAVVIAALAHIPEVDANSRVCCLITGSGIKELPWLTAHAPETPLVAPDLQAIAEAAGQP